MSRGSNKTSANTLQDGLNVGAAISPPNRHIGEGGIAKSFVTPPATVLIAFLWQPMRFPGGQEVYMAEVSLPDPLDSVPPTFLENGQSVYRVVARRQPVLMDGQRKAAALAGEIGPGSVVRLSLMPSGRSLIVRAALILEHRMHDVFFQDLELAG
jgi:hypothetical protein